MRHTHPQAWPHSTAWQYALVAGKLQVIVFNVLVEESIDLFPETRVDKIFPLWTNAD